MLFAPHQLHIPDGFYNLVISIFFWIITVIIIGFAISKTNHSVKSKSH
jgi:ABC-type Co2+ transport system permease subunit